MPKKLKNCKTCGAEMAPDAKTCPKCGAKNKPPFYKKWWFYAIIIILVCVGVAGGGQSGKPDSPPGPAAGNPPAESGASKQPEDKEDKKDKEPEAVQEPVSYTQYNVTELFDALSGNALKAEKTFQGQYVELSGYLSVIDSDGKYISVGAAQDDWDYMLQTVQCYVKNDGQLDQIMEMTTGDAIVVRGKIKDVGEILGYQMDIDSMN